MSKRIVLIGETKVKRSVRNRKTKEVETRFIPQTEVYTIEIEEGKSEYTIDTVHTGEFHLKSIGCSETSDELIQIEGTTSDKVFRDYTPINVVGFIAGGSQYPVKFRGVKFKKGEAVTVSIKSP